MTTYNTGNAVGSTAPKDLYDNAENLDELLNSTTKTFHPDRLGVNRRTYEGMEQAFNAMLQSVGYDYLGAYAGGIEFTSYNQIVSGSGEFWKISSGTSLPYTTTGAGIDEGGALVSVGDAVIRQDLASTATGMGAELVAKLTVDTPADLAALGVPSSAIPVYVQRYSVSHALGDGSGGFFVWDSSDLSTEVAADTEEGVFVAPSGGDGSTGAWVRHFDKEVNVKWFGAFSDGTTDDTTAIQAFFDYLQTTSETSVDITMDSVVSAKVTLDGVVPRVFNGRCRITSNFVSDDYILEILNTSYSSFTGQIKVYGKGTSVFTSRDNLDLVYINYCQRSSFNYLETRHAKNNGVTVENSNLLSIGTLKSIYNGSAGTGVITDKTYSFTAKTDYETSGSTIQYSRLTFDTTDDLTFYDSKYVKAQIDGEIYQVKNIDNTTKEVDVYPWIDTGTTTGDVVFIFGTGLSLIGGNGGQASHIGLWESTGNGMGYYAMSLYPPMVGSMHCEYNGIGVLVGENSGAVVGGSCQKAYFEGNTFDIVQGTLAFAEFEILGNTALDLSKSLKLAPRLSDNSYHTSFNYFYGLLVHYNSIDYTSELSSRIPTYTKTYFSPSAAPIPVDIEDYIETDDDVRRLFNIKRYFAIVAVNHGAGGIDTVTFTPPSGFTANGGATAVFSTFTDDIATFHVIENRDTANYKVVQTST